MNAKTSKPMYRRKTKTMPMPLKIPVAGVLLLGLYACTQNLAVGLLFVAVGTAALTLHDGVEIDLENGRIRQYWGLAGLKFGAWETLPAPDRLTLVSVRNTHTVFGSRTGSSTQFEQRAFEVHLYPHGAADHYVVSTGTYDAAKADAALLSNHWELACEDFAIRA